MNNEHSYRLGKTNARDGERRRIAKALCATCSEETIADILNALLCVDCEPSLSDRESESGQRLFDQLSDMRPDAVSMAMGQ